MDYERIVADWIISDRKETVKLLRKLAKENAPEIVVKVLIGKMEVSKLWSTKMCWHIYLQACGFNVLNEYQTQSIEAIEEGGTELVGGDALEDIIVNEDRLAFEKIVDNLSKIQRKYFDQFQSAKTDEEIAETLGIELPAVWKMKRYLQSLFAEFTDTLMLNSGWTKVIPKLKTTTKTINYKKKLVSDPTVDSDNSNFNRRIEQQRAEEEEEKKHNSNKKKGGE